MSARRIIAGVMGSGSRPYETLAGPLGKLIAQAGYHLLTGGGAGVMAEVSRSFCRVRDRRGSCIGIILSEEAPDLDAETGKRAFRPGTANRWVEIPIFTHLPLSGTRGMDFMSRNHINVLSADLLFALPGSAGTFSEVMLRMQYGRPVILFLGRETIDGKRADRIRAESPEPNLLLEAKSIGEVSSRIEQSLEIHRPAG